MSKQRLIQTLSWGLLTLSVENLITNSLSIIHYYCYY